MREQEQEDDIERRAASAVGTVLDRKWRLDRLLGCGGMGAVYSATHRNGTRAAVKVLHPEAALSPSLRRRFLREGYVANKVEHPGAVSILDDDIDPAGCAYLVMELLQGETLEGRLARAGGRLGAPEVIQIVCAVLDCLEAAHARGIVHRDIKPGNLFLTTDGAVKVLDFGIARLSETRGRRGDTTGLSALGTPDFMPPEQARGHWEQVDGQSDVFAVGAVMLFALTGMPLRDAPTTNEQLLRAMTEPLPSLSTLLPSASEFVLGLVDRAVAFRKEDRWPDAAAFRQAARAAYGSIAAQPLERAPPLSVRPVPSSPLSVESIPMDDQLASAEDALLSMPAAALSARSMSPTKIIAGRPRSPFVRVAAVVVTVAGALFAMSFRAERPARSSTPTARRAVPALVPVVAHAEKPVAAPLTPPAEAPVDADKNVQGVAKAEEPVVPKPATLETTSRRAARARRAPPAEVESAPEPPPTPPAPLLAETSSAGSHAVDLFSRRK